VHERYRQTTDGRTTAYSEREFTFAKINYCVISLRGEPIASLFN